MDSLVVAQVLLTVDIINLSHYSASMSKQSFTGLELSLSVLFGTTSHLTQHPGNWTQQKGQTESDGGCSDATSPFLTNTC